MTVGRFDRLLPKAEALRLAKVTDKADVPGGAKLPDLGDSSKDPFPVVPGAGFWVHNAVLVRLHCDRVPREPTEEAVGAWIEFHRQVAYHSNFLSDPGAAERRRAELLADCAALRNYLSGLLAQDGALRSTSGGRKAGLRRAVTVLDDFLRAASGRPQAQGGDHGATDTGARRAKANDRAGRGLAILTEHPEMTATELAKRLGVARQTVYKDPILSKALAARRSGKNELARAIVDEDGGLVDAYWRDE
jgi:hypothetical protein